MPESASFGALKELYFSLDRNFARLFAACQTNEQRDQLRRDYATARDNFQRAVNLVFQENNDAVKSLTTELSAAQSDINRALENLQDIAALLQMIAKTVQVGSSLVALGAAV